MIDNLELSRVLTHVIAAVDGVGDIYASGPLVQAVALSLVNAISEKETDDAKVAVDRDASGGLLVSATIGIVSGHAAQTVLRNASDNVRSFLIEQYPSMQIGGIHVKVSRIETEITTRV